MMLAMLAGVRWNNPLHYVDRSFVLSDTRTTCARGLHTTAVYAIKLGVRFRSRYKVYITIITLLPNFSAR